MASKYTVISPEQINDNAIKLIGSDWMLVAAGTKDDYNMMTAAWGGIGYLWKYPVSFIFVRPQRYTYEFTEKYDHFTLNFFNEEYRKMLSYCGTHSGREVNKTRECGLTIKETANGIVSFNEARMILECKKVYADDIKPECLLENQLEEVYPKKDFHRLYIGRIEKCLVKA